MGQQGHKFPVHYGTRKQAEWVQKQVKSLRNHFVQEVTITVTQTDSSTSKWWLNKY